MGHHSGDISFWSSVLVIFDYDTFFAPSVLCGALLFFLSEEVLRSKISSVSSHTSKKIVQTIKNANKLWCFPIYTFILTIDYNTFKLRLAPPLLHPADRVVVEQFWLKKECLPWAAV